MASVMAGLPSHTLWKLRMMKRTSTGSKDESYEHVLMCLICRSLFDDYDHQPKFLPCHHTFCKDCLREYCRQIGDEIECPSCRKIANIPAAGVAALQTNFYVKYIQSLVSGGSGQSCHPLECSKHAKEKLQFYCKDCEKSICKECCNESDYPCPSHEKVPITKITEESHQKLDASFSSANATVEDKKVKLEKALKALAEEKDSALLKIDSTFEQHAHTLTRRATLLKNKVIDIYNEHVEKLESDLMEISTALTCIVSLKDYHEDKISHGDYKEFAKGIEEMEEVDRNISDRIHPVETHIMFEGGHGSEKYRACAKDLGRVKFNRMVSVPRTEPEGNDSAAGTAQASGSVPSSPVESPKHQSPETPTTPTPPEGGVQTPDGESEPAGRCLPGTGFCDSAPSTPVVSHNEKAEAAVADTVKLDNMKSSMTQSQNTKLRESNVCDVKLNKPSSSTISNNNNLPKQKSPTPEKSKGSTTGTTRSNVTPPKQKPVMNTMVSTKAENVKDTAKSSPAVSSSPNEGHSSPVGQEKSAAVPMSSDSPGVAWCSTPVGGKGRPRNLLTPVQRPTNSTVATSDSVPENSSPNTQQGGNCKTNLPKSPKDGVAMAAASQTQGCKPSRLPGMSGLCRIPKPRSVPAKVLDGRKVAGVAGMARRSPPGQRLSPSGQCSQGNFRNNGNNPKVANPVFVPSRNANGNITMHAIPEGVVNANDSDKARAEKEYYHLLYTSYDEEELLKELKSGKANLDDSDSWMTISSGDESNSTNCSDEVLVETDQTTF